MNRANTRGARSGALRYKPKVAGSIPDGFIGIFHLHTPSGPGVDGPSDRNEYQEYFLGGGVKGPGA